MTEYFEKYQITPEVVVANQAFMTPHMEAYNNRQNIKPVATGSGSMAEQSRSCRTIAETSAKDHASDHP